MEETSLEYFVVDELPYGLQDRQIRSIGFGRYILRKRFFAVWRLAGKNEVRLPVKNAATAKIIYPTNLGIGLKKDVNGIILTFPKKYMAVVIEIPNY